MQMVHLGTWQQSVADIIVCQDDSREDRPQFGVIRESKILEVDGNASTIANLVKSVHLPRFGDEARLSISQVLVMD